MDDDKIIVSVDVLDSMKSDLKKHCKDCSLYVDHKDELCYGCRLCDVVSTLDVMISGDVNEWN